MKRHNPLGGDKDNKPPELSMRDKLLDACRSGTLMSAIEEAYQIDDIAQEDIARELAILHNDGAIDIVEEFLGLSNDEAGLTFFGLRSVFERALPGIVCDIMTVMRCVHHLVHEAGGDLLAGTTIDYFITFLMKDPSRPEQAIRNIKGEQELHDLLPAILIAGSKFDIQKYLEVALEIMRSDDVVMRKQAVFALGKIEWSDENKPSEAVYVALEEIVDAKTNDDILAATAKTAANLIKHDSSQVDRLICIANTAIQKGGDLAIHIAASLLMLADKNMPEALIDKLLEQLNRVNPQHKGTIDQIDHALCQLIRSDKKEVAILTLESLITENALEPDTFDSVLHAIQCDTALLNKITTRWLLNGYPSLCNAAEFVVGSGRGANVPAEIDPAEITMTNKREVIFLARKICGYFFMNPISVASMLLSLLQLAEDDQTRMKIGELILDPLLINYPGKARTFINERTASCSHEVRQVINKVDEELEKYFEALRSIDEIPELIPSEAQREAYQRHHSRKMEESFKEAEKKSVFLGLISKQTLLYGTSSVIYVHDGQGNRHRQEIPLKVHSVEIDVPRMMLLDPLGLEYQLAIFRAEKRKE